MRKSFYPKYDYPSAYEIPYTVFYEKGIRGVIFDIDNTLVRHDAPANGRVKQLFISLKELGIKTCLLSNNKEPRVSSFAAEVNSLYISKAGKPKTGNYRKAMNLMGTDETSTLFVGDQLFTDVYGANRTGIPSILVKPIHPKEEIQIVIKRRLEAVVLYFYRRQKSRKQKQQGI